LEPLGQWPFDLTAAFTFSLRLFSQLDAFAQANVSRDCPGPVCFLVRRMQSRLVDSALAFQVSSLTKGLQWPSNLIHGTNFNEVVLSKGRDCSRYAKT